MALIILKSGYGVVKRSGHILLEGTPDHLDLEKIKTELPQNFPDIIDTHHIHAWSLTAEKTLLTLHVRIAETADIQTLLPQINRFLAANYQIEHATVQFEHGTCC